MGGMAGWTKCPFRLSLGQVSPFLVQRQPASKNKKTGPGSAFPYPNLPMNHGSINNTCSPGSHMSMTKSNKRPIHSGGGGGAHLFLISTHAQVTG